MLPLIALGVVSASSAVGAWAIRKFRNRVKPSIQLERAAVYETALATIKDPFRLRSLAVSFRAQGMNNEADLLEKRAALRDAPPEVRKARKTLFQTTMKSGDPVQILAIADEFEKLGATANAMALRQYASSLIHPGDKS